MKIYRNCAMETFYASDAQSLGSICTVKFDFSKIIVEYQDNRGLVMYIGDSSDNGHFRLTCEDRKGRATLHLCDDNEYLEGYWIEEGYYGMWRIQLEDEE